MSAAHPGPGSEVHMAGSSGAVALWFRQLRVMLRKNFLTLARSPRSSIVQLLVPVILVLLLFLVDIGIRSNPSNKEITNGDLSPSPLDVGLLQECVRVNHLGNPLPPDSYTCITVAYTPENDPVVEAIIDKIKSQNGITKTQAFATQEAFNDYAFKNRNSTQGALHFEIGYSDPATPSLANLQSISYVVQYNQTRDRFRTTFVDSQYQVLIPYTSAVNQAVLSLANDLAATPAADFSFNFDMLPYPHPSISPTDAVGSYGSIFFFGVLMFNIVMQLNQIVGERELHLRTSMHQMGLSVSAYWVSYFITNTILNTLSALLLIAVGSAFQFKFFLKTNFFVYFLLFFCFGLSLVTLVFLLSNFVSKARTGTILGFAMFLIGMLVQAAGSLVLKDTVSIGIRVFFIIQPWSLLAKSMDTIGFYASSDYLNGMTWAQRTDGFMSVSEVCLLLLLDALIFLVIGIYLDVVLPDENGMSQSCFFCFKPSYWCPNDVRVLGSIEPDSGNKRTKNTDGTDASGVAAAGSDPASSNSPDGANSPAADNDGDDGDEHAQEDDAAAIAAQIKATQMGEDPDVLAEGERVRNTLDVNYPVRIDQLGKTYYARTCCCIRQPERDFQAVKEINLILDKNSLFCLLGHNGAGKSTTISMMTGLLGPTSGDARVLGYSVVNGMHEIKKRMGVCPQHDVLFRELTAAEHLELFAAFKNVPTERMHLEVAERLADVDLTKYAGVAAGTFSGGMKRRLSVAIALIGNPAIVYLDEPTTGMDHVAARQVWDLIEKVKYDRVTVLTTHSMEEADVLGDRIGIMKEGKLICLGTSIRLKNKFGTGYRVSVFVDGQAADEERRARIKGVTAYVKQAIPGAIVESVEASVVRFKVPRAASRLLANFFASLEAESERLGVTDIQTSLTTLEEVFMTVGSLGEDHTDSRFGVSSQIGTELSKALVRLAEIHDIQAKRLTDPGYNPVIEDAAVVEVDNSPEALALELVQLEEIKLVSDHLERIKLGFERNRYTALARGTPAKQAEWTAARAAGLYLTTDAIGAAATAAGIVLNDPTHPASAAAAAATDGAGAGAGSASPPGQHPARVTPHAGSAHNTVADGDAGAVEMTQMGGNKGNGNNGGDAETDADDAVYEAVSAEMAQEQETVIKEYLRRELLVKSKRCCGSFRRTWRKWSCCQRFLFVLLWVVILLVVIIVIALIVNSGSSSDDLYPALTVFAGAPLLSELPTNRWVEIVPDAATANTGCARGDAFSYFVYIPPAGTNDARNVLFQLGGTDGVCFNAGTCDSALPTVQYAVTVDTDRASIRYRNFTGVFQKNGYNDAQFATAAENPNPFKNYLHVYVPLCSADAHWGAETRVYNAGQTINHFGGNNVKAAFDWLTQQAYVPTATPATTPADTSVVAAGTAAGAWGAALWSAQLRAAYDGVAHVFYLGDDGINLVDVGTSLATFTPAATLTPSLTTASPDTTTFFNNIFATAAGDHANLWGLASSPAMPVGVAGLAAPIDPATFTVEAALGAIAAQYTTDFTVLRTNVLFPYARLQAMTRAIQTADTAVITAATRTVATPLQNMVTPIGLLVPQAWLDDDATALTETGFIPSSARTLGSGLLLASVCTQIGLRDAALSTAAGASAAQVGTFTTMAGTSVLETADVRSALSSVLMSSSFFSGESQATPAVKAVDWIAQSVTTREPATGVAAAADCAALIAALVA